MSTVVVIDEETVVITEAPVPSVVVTESPAPEIVQIIAEGPQGPPGPPGPSGAGGNTITRDASTAIGGQRLVIGTSGGEVAYADSTNDAHLGKILGLSLNAANIGEEVEVLLFGYTEFNGWSWNTTLPIYASSNGLLTQTPPTTGFSQIVATAETATRIYLRLREPIDL